MSTLEIIHLRSSGEPLENLADLIRESIWAEGKGTEVATVYRRHGLDTDVAVHLRGDGPNALAAHLALALREYGLVEHTVWEEIPAEPASSALRHGGPSWFGAGFALAKKSSLQALQAECRLWPSRWLGRRAQRFSR